MSNINFVLSVELKLKQIVKFSSAISEIFFIKWHFHVYSTIHQHLIHFFQFLRIKDSLHLVLFRIWHVFINFDPNSYFFKRTQRAFISRNKINMFRPNRTVWCFSFCIFMVDENSNRSIYRKFSFSRIQFTFQNW